jgi:hypothetical protein
LVLLAGAQDAGRADAGPADLRAADGLTREEPAGFYAGLAGVQFQPKACVAGFERFDDVPASNPFCPWIEELARRGITSGCTGTQYCPSNPVTRAQMAVFIVRSMEVCPTLDPTDEMVRVGGVCIDKYEASLWDAPVGGNLITGAIPCSPTGRNCTNIYARSVAGVPPRFSVTWFQAQQALANSGKRLPTNAEWQMAAAGTPDHPGPCNTDSGTTWNTGSNPGCISNHGAFDMVGNLREWVADWVPGSTTCPGWGSFSDDVMCLSGATTTAQNPGIVIRGGDFLTGSSSGPFAVDARWLAPPPFTVPGFRGAR